MHQLSVHLPFLAQGDGGVTTHLDQLGQTPYWVLGGYLGLLLLLGAYGWLRSKADEEDYYLAGRSQGWVVSSLTIMATFFSSFALLGAPGLVYRDGVVFALFSLNVPVAGLSVYVLGSRIWRLGRHFGYITPGDMIAHYYGSRRSLRLLVALVGFLYAIPYVVMQIQAGGHISQKMFGEDSFYVGAALLAAITMLYIIIGGMRSVAWTDMIQGLLLISGMLVGGMAMLLLFDGPANFGDRVTSELPDSSLIAPGNSGAWTWTMLFSICCLGSVGSMVQPAQWMRFYSARSAKTLRRGAVIFAAVLTSCFMLGVMMIGLAGQVLYPLHQGYIIEVAEAPETLADVPDSLRDNFRYVPPNPSDTKATGQLIWSWPLADKGYRLDAGDESQLRSLSNKTSFQLAIDQLTQRDAVRVGAVASGDFDAALATSSQPKLMPNPAVDPNPAEGTDYDSILVVVLSGQMPRVLGQFGAIFASIMIICIMAASMSTADSNLHALSAVMTRDVYDQFIRPQASERERVWVGRALILAATTLALFIVFVGRQPVISQRYDVLNMIAKMGLMAIAFSAQLLPITIDILFLRKGTGKGAAAGLAVGVTAAFLFGPLFTMTADALGLEALAATIQAPTKVLKVHGSVWGLIFNIAIFVLVSRCTRQVPTERRDEFANVLAGAAQPK